MNYTLPFSFSCKQLMSLAGRAAELLGDPFGEMETSVKNTYKNDTDTTSRDAWGHVVHVRRSWQSVMPSELEITARIEGLPGGVTVTFNDGDVVAYDERIGRRCEITGRQDAADATHQAWLLAMFEAASDATLEDTWGAPPGWEANARACLRAATRCSFERIKSPRTNCYNPFWTQYIFGEKDGGPRFCAGFQGDLGLHVSLSPVIPVPRGMVYMACVSAFRMPVPPCSTQRAENVETVESRLDEPRALPRTGASDDVPSLADLVGLYNPRPAPPPAVVPVRKPSVVKDFNADAFVANVHGAGAWRVRVLREKSPNRTLEIRVQHDEGATPSSFTDWQAFVYREDMQTHFVGEEQEVRAAASRLVAWLESQGWTTTVDGPEQ